ncbi:MAG: hypothetical protein ACPL7C_10600, partial [Anaerolineae bacterium]
TTDHRRQTIDDGPPTTDDEWRMGSRIGNPTYWSVKFMLMGRRRATVTTVSSCPTGRMADIVGRKDPQKGC